MFVRSRVLRPIQELDELQRYLLPAALKAWSTVNGTEGCIPRGEGGTVESNPIRPPVHLVETDTAFELKAMVAGLNPETLVVELSPESKVQTLLIEGEFQCGKASSDKPEDQGINPDKKPRIHIDEFPSGTFRRVFEFGVPLNPEAIQAGYKNGILTITLPKILEVAKTTTRIPIQLES